ncbi:glycerol-3-phosphate 1-O-acyltransferase PlsY [uncultured Megasphaera sp.]|uniref:glycerol-3-phosphate 1-O-acyltransferase PlsY n=1 Tax=uncultured Megasphaera sp. TaxID=165188 RepID=UPI00265920C3|nr:glycerol-3-phosphate 1-O-acyltransferase PlsY [uncultured Megasphaera sp.]
MITSILCLILAYLAGSFPSGLVIGRAIYHTDLREYGSHNTGATNAYRVFGPAGGLAVLVLDAAKGMLGVYLGQLAAASLAWPPEQQVYLMVAGGCLAIIGHSCSIFLKFKGGKGVATGLGIILFLAPWETLIVFAGWCLIVAVTRIVSLGSIVGAVAVPILMYVFGEPLPVLLFGIIAAVLVVVRHKDNIIRLLQGKELKVERIHKK